MERVRKYSHRLCNWKSKTNLLHQRRRIQS